MTSTPALAALPTTITSPRLPGGLDAETIAAFLAGEVDALAIPEPAWGPIGRAVYKRTYSRDLFVRDPGTGNFLVGAGGAMTPQPWLADLGLSAPAPTKDGQRTGEVWAETIRRVVLGNLGYAAKTTGEPIDTAEAVELFALMHSGRALPAGRHLWTTGTNSPWSRNCWASGWSARTSDHSRYLASRLFEGGGVGSNYSSDLIAVTSPVRRAVQVRITCRPEHTDFDAVSSSAGDAMLSDAEATDFLVSQGATLFSVTDTREGWVDAWSAIIDLATTSGPSPLMVVVDVSGLRPFGAPLRTFGGTASGPAPFVTAALEIAAILRRAACEGGRHLSGLEFMEIDHQIAASVVAGGARRSARMSLKHWRDADILDFVHCKANGGHWSTNISVEIDDDFTSALDRGDMHAETVLKAMCEGMARNAEPGWMNSSEHSRFEPGQIRNVNPCVTGDAWVQTTAGLRQVSDLVGAGKVDLLVDDQVWSTGEEGFFATGHREVLALDVDGTVLKVTPEHLVSTPDGWRPAGELSAGDVVDLTASLGSSWGGEGTWDEGYLVGHLIGDGYFGPDTPGGQPGSAHLCVWHTDSGSESMKSQIMASIEAAGLRHRSDWVGFCDTSNRDEQELRSAALRDLAARFGVVKGSKKITDEIMAASSDFVRGVLSALFDTDGHVEGDSTGGGLSVRLTQSDDDMLGRARTLLLALGIRSVVRPSHPEGRESIIRGASHIANASYRLVISGTHVESFDKLVGFQHEAKASLLGHRIESMTRGFYTKPMVGVLRSVVSAGTEDVFDAQVPGKNAFVANGTVIHNCGEASLTTRNDADGSANGESCNLGSVNLEMFGRDLDGAVRAYELLARFLYRATLNPYPDDLANEIEADNRRIGAGFMGLQGWCLAHGVKLSDLPRSEYLRDALDTFRVATRASADAFADSLGLPRPVKVTAIAPTGSISQMFGTQAGGHPVNATWYIRNVRYSTADPEVESLRAQGYKVETAVVERNTVVVSFPTEDVILSHGYDEALVESAGDISLDAFAAVTLAIQETFCAGADGQAVSATGQLAPKQTPEEVVAQVRGYLGLKGFTAFPVGSYIQPPIEAVAKETYTALVEDVAFMASVYGDSNDGECASGACPIK